MAPSCSLFRRTKYLECGGYSHLKKVCKKKGQTDCVDIATIDHAQEHVNRSNYTVSLQIENMKIEFDVDCGAAVTLVSQSWLKLNFQQQWLLKTNLEKENVKCSVQKFFFHYRVTPIPELKKSPAKIMFGRKLRNRLDLLSPKELEIKKELMESNETRNFQIGNKIAARKYLNKESK